MLKRLVPILVVVAVLVGLLFYSQWRPEVASVSGVVEADEVRLGSRVGGRVAEVLVEEGQLVDPDQPLVRLEPFDLREKRAEAAAQLAQRQAELDKLLEGYREQEIAQAVAHAKGLVAHLKMLKDGPRPQEIEAARARQRLAEASLARANEDYKRDSRLAAERRGAVTQEELDRRIEELKVAQANLEVRNQELELLLQGTREEEIDQAAAQLEEAQAAADLVKTGFRDEEKEQARAAVAAAQAALAVIDSQIAELVIKAPTIGRIEAIDLQPGDLVPAGAPVLSMLNTKDPWIRAYVPENRLDIKPNERLRVTIDAYPGREFVGTVVFVARQAEFTPSNVQTPEERSKQVVRIKVHIDNPPDDLRPGTSADVWLDQRGQP